MAALVPFEAAAAAAAAAACWLRLAKFRSAVEEFVSGELVAGSEWS